MLKKILFVALLISTILSASTNEVDKLVGTYSANYYGKQNDRYRIEKHNNNFWVFENQGNAKWKRVHEKGKVNIINKKRFEKIFKTSVNKPSYGLNFDNRILIFKTKKGFSIGRFKTTTGYFVFFDGIFLELKKEK